MKINNVEKILTRYLDRAYPNAYILIDRSIQEGKEIVCRLTKRIVENALDVFSVHQMISPETMIRPLFMNQTEMLIATFIDQTLSDYHRTLSFIMGSFEVNQLLNTFSSNWQVDFSDEKENNIIATKPRVFSSSNCTCATTSDCTDHIGEGVVSGCFPFDGFRSTKFEHTTLGELNNKLFVKEWHFRTDYLTYYHLICRPTECRIMQFDWNNLLYILIIAIGLYGGTIYDLKLDNTVVIFIGLTYSLHMIMGQTSRDCCRRRK